MSSSTPGSRTSPNSISTEWISHTCRQRDVGDGYVSMQNNDVQLHGDRGVDLLPYHSKVSVQSQSSSIGGPSSSWSSISYLKPCSSWTSTSDIKPSQVQKRPASRRLWPVLALLSAVALTICYFTSLSPLCPRRWVNRDGTLVGGVEKHVVIASYVRPVLLRSVC